jgi:hypothetical protein
MSTLKERVKSKAHAWVRRELVELPDTGETVQVCGLVTGEISRITEAKGTDQSVIQVALGTEDPASGEKLWNANSLPDRKEIEALPPRDTLMIVEAINRLSGVGEKAREEGNERSTEVRSSTTSSPSVSASASASSESE